MKSSILLASCLSATAFAASPDTIATKPFGKTKGGIPVELYTLRNGFCLEPQHFPDSPNKPEFPSGCAQAGANLQEHDHLQVRHKIAENIHEN